MIESFEQLPIGKFEEIVSIQESEMRPFDKTTGIISVLTDIPDTELEQLELVEFAKLSEKAKFLTMAPPQKVRSIGKVYRYGGMEFIPTTDAKHLTAGQFVDFQTYMNGGEVDKVALMSILLIPKGKRYNEGYDIEEVKRIIRDEMPVTAYHALSAFFFKKCAKCIEHSQRYLERMIMAQKIKEKMQRIIHPNTNASGDGSHK